MGYELWVVDYGEAVEVDLPFLFVVQIQFFARISH